MRHFENMDILRDKLQENPDWGYSMTVGDRTYHLHHYGPGLHVDLGFYYVCFRHNPTQDLIVIEYESPHKGDYKLLSIKCLSNVSVN